MIWQFVNLYGFQENSRSHKKSHCLKLISTFYQDIVTNQCKTNCYSCYLSKYRWYTLFWWEERIRKQVYSAPLVLLRTTEIPLRLWKMSPSAEQEKLDIPISLSNEELSEKLLSFSNQVNRFVLKIFNFLSKYLYCKLW